MPPTDVARLPRCPAITQAARRAIGACGYPARAAGAARSAPVGIRTPDLRFRRPTLYPAELRALGGQRVATPVETEREGFEPSMEREPHTRLAGECLQPLGHLSARGRL